MPHNNALPLSGKIALVTGASRGLGRATALALAKSGAHVLALARTTGGLEELDDDIRAAGGTASLIPLDLAEPESVDQLGAALGARFDRLDIIVANAAVLGELAPIPDIDPKIWQAVLDINLTANWRLIRSLDPLIRNAAAARLAFVTSSVGGAKARAFWGAYAVSKAGLEMLAQTYAEELRNATARVAIIDPGAMQTGMRAEAMPGENPETLPTAGSVVPLILEAVSEDYDGIAERLIARDRRAAGEL
ncbi:MAG: SDR family NAD(P)-dependent oxidoreductase [Pseudomonadota bacterium]